MHQKAKMCMLRKRKVTYFHFSQIFLGGSYSALKMTQESINTHTHKSKNHLRVFIISLIIFQSIYL